MVKWTKKYSRNEFCLKRSTCTELTAGEMAYISLKSYRNADMLNFCDLSWGSAGVWVLNSCSPVHWEPSDFISLQAHRCRGQLFLSRCQTHRHLLHLLFTQTLYPACPALFHIIWSAFVYSIVPIRNIQLKFYDYIFFVFHFLSLFFT